MSDEDVKKVEATENDAKTEEKKDPRSFKAKSFFAKKRIKEKKGQKAEVKSSEETAKPSSGKLAHAMVSMATAATVGMGFAPNVASAATPGDYNKERSTQLAKNLNYEYADNKDMHFKPLTESEAAMLEASIGDGKTASFTRARQEMNAQTSRMATRQATRTAARQATSYEEIIDNALAKYQRSNPNCELTYMDDLSQIVDTHPYSKYGGFCAVFASDNVQTGKTEYVFITQNPRRGPYKVLGEHEVETALNCGNGFFACGRYCTFGGRRYHVGGRGATSVRVNAGSHGVNVGARTSGRRGGGYVNIGVNNRGRIHVNGGFTLGH